MVEKLDLTDLGDKFRELSKLEAHLNTAEIYDHELSEISDVLKLNLKTNRREELFPSYEKAANELKELVTNNSVQLEVGFESTKYKQDSTNGHVSRYKMSLTLNENQPGSKSGFNVNKLYYLYELMSNTGDDDFEKITSEGFINGYFKSKNLENSNGTLGDWREDQTLETGVCDYETRMIILISNDLNSRFSSINERLDMKYDCTVTKVDMMEICKQLNSFSEQFDNLEFTYQVNL